jgi:hypothetical protein
LVEISLVEKQRRRRTMIPFLVSFIQSVDEYQTKDCVFGNAFGPSVTQVLDVDDLWKRLTVLVSANLQIISMGSIKLIKMFKSD